MKGYLTSYADLFNVRPRGAPSVASVEIPLIQRDYAQGRPEASVEEIRINFLEVLIEAIAGGQPVGLDFVYGRTEGTTFYPVDGQQRLTTLFLLHWYVAFAADRLEPDAPWTGLSYATRPSARRFCQRLVTERLPRDEELPSAWITDQAWYRYAWRNDPTVQAMLVMLDAIHTEIHRLQPELDAPAAWERLTDTDAPAISFYLLPLEEMESDEDLYIKMNSRGKPLTPFENFKARFEHDIRNSDRANEFAQKIDGLWSDLLWPIHGGDNIVDDEFIRYIDFVTEICELRDGRVVSDRLVRRSRTVFGAENAKAHEHLGFLFDAFDKWQDQAHVNATFTALFSTALPGSEQYDCRKIVLFGPASANLFERCCHLFDGRRGRNREFTLQESLLLYAILLHLIEDTYEFPRRLRVLRNLIAASDNEVRRPNMPGLVNDVEEVIVNGDLDAITRFSTNQVEDERLKQEFLDTDPELRDALFRLEDHPILRGTLSCFDLDRRTFRARAEGFEAALADPTKWLALTGGLLAVGDYQRQRPNSSAWQFGTSSTANEGVWRYLLTAAPRKSLAATRNVLGQFLDGFARSGSDIENHCHALMEARVSQHEEANLLDWRYYLVKYPSMREGATGIYHGVDGKLGYSMCMLRKTQLNSYYRDPILLQVWRSSEVGDTVQEPWFTGYETTPRWLRLVRSGVGMRSVGEGFMLQSPDNPELEPAFADLCSRRLDIGSPNGALVLQIPQENRGGSLFDSVDRVAVGATFLKELVEAGL